jgi:NAD(P)-dependent dehydrogenase (short-subunit alcohol dehydrogenase family)
MIARGQGGSVIITSSSAGLTSISLNTSPGALGYSAAKHGVVGLMRVYAKQLAPHSIRVNTIHPTAVNTPMVANEGYAQFLVENPDVMNDPSYKNAMPVEMVEPSDIANAAVFLASDEARYVTGVPFPVDAGYIIR